MQELDILSDITNLAFKLDQLRASGASCNTCNFCEVAKNLNIPCKCCLYLNTLLRLSSKECRPFFTIDMEEIKAELSRELHRIKALLEILES